MNLKGGKVHRVVAQAFGAIGQDVAQVGANPVKYRHEVVNDGANILGGEITQGGDVIIEQRLEITGAGFDIFVNGHRFDCGPTQTGSGQNGFALGNGRLGPSFTVRNLMKRSENGGGTRLADVSQRHRIFGAVPAE